MDLAEKKILLTGASSGIGRALAIQLAGEGARLALTARRTDLLGALVDDIAAAGHPRPFAATADLSVAGAAASLATVVLDHFEGSIDVLINNAGASVTGPQSRIGDSAEARALFEVNLWSPLALSAALLPCMLTQDHGTIVNVTSTAQAVPFPLLGYYGSSKSALAQATRSLRRELAETPIRVMEVVPGATDTALRNVDDLPWKTQPVRTFRPATVESSAAAIVHGLERGSTRVVHPTFSQLPLQIPLFGELIARLVGRRVNTLDALDP